jgi:hypothetical protein
VGRANHSPGAMGCLNLTALGWLASATTSPSISRVFRPAPADADIDDDSFLWCRGSQLSDITRRHDWLMRCIPAIYGCTGRPLGSPQVRFPSCHKYITTRVEIHLLHLKPLVYKPTIDPPIAKYSQNEPSRPPSDRPFPHHHHVVHSSPRCRILRLHICSNRRTRSIHKYVTCIPTTSPA